jgi:hypothetical protein
MGRVSDTSSDRGAKLQERQGSDTRFEVLMAMKMSILVFWIVMRHGGEYCLNYQSSIPTSTVKIRIWETGRVDSSGKL